ncbi:hypothetical protein BJX63DRAFT_401757 [Aspergillus granulosus]|uniref:Zn(2)-C6 fungal-type domain-containing protein n=1 Tax=Aspergillus granulosus TaxID=176169 RepID=A0ABR4H504_9EURO
MASTSPRGARENKTRRRSRFGCRNCKLRKLKCDEAKPQCRRCCSFGVLCNFISGVADLQPTAAITGTSLGVCAKAKLQRPLTNAIWTSDAWTSYQLNARCQDFITKYLGRSLITPHDPSMRQVNRRLLELAFAHPFLMHASLAVALTYDRHLNGSLECRRTVEECYHWSQSTVLLNKRLSEPIVEEEKDPIWGTAAALVILTFSSPDASTPEEAWPVKSCSDPSGPSDLSWLCMNECKMALWQTLNPLRPGSLFRVMEATYAKMNTPLPERGIDGIPSALAAICNLTDSSMPDTSPYFGAAHAVSHILNLPDIEVTTGPTQLFIQSIHGPFKQLLLKRDPVALLLLYLWYRKVGRCIWWIGLRARVECPAICLYLRRCRKGNADVLALLPEGALGDWWN